MSFNIEFSQIISFLKICYKNKKIFVRYKQTPWLVMLLEVFKKEKMISGYYMYQDACYILLKYNQLGEPVIKHLEIMYRRPFIFNFTYEQLKSKQFLTQYFSQNDMKTTNYIFLTNKGLLSYNEMLTKKIGGTLLLLIKYNEI